MDKVPVPLNCYYQTKKKKKRVLCLFRRPEWAASSETSQSQSVFGGICINRRLLVNSFVQPRKLTSALWIRPMGSNWHYISGAFLRKNLAQTPWTVAVANMPLHAHTASTVGVLLPLPYSKDFVFLYKMKIKLHSSWRDAFLTQCRWSSVNYRCILAISMKWSRNKCTLCTGDELE